MKCNVGCQEITVLPYLLQFPLHRAAVGCVPTVADATPLRTSGWLIIGLASRMCAHRGWEEAMSFDDCTADVDDFKRLAALAKVDFSISEKDEAPDEEEIPRSTSTPSSRSSRRQRYRLIRTSSRSSWRRVGTTCLRRSPRTPPWQTCSSRGTASASRSGATRA